MIDLEHQFQGLHHIWSTGVATHFWSDFVRVLRIQAILSEQHHNIDNDYQRKQTFNAIVNADAWCA